MRADDIKAAFAVKGDCAVVVIPHAEIDRSVARLSRAIKTGLHQRLRDAHAVKLAVDIKPLDLDGRKTPDAIRDVAVVEFGEGDRRGFDLGDQKSRARVGELRREFLQGEIL